MNMTTMIEFSDSGSGNPNDCSEYQFGTLAINGDVDWIDYSINVQFKSSDDDAIGFIFHYIDKLHHYRLVFSNEDGCSAIIKVTFLLFLFFHFFFVTINPRQA